MYQASEAAIEAVEKTPYVFVYGTLMEAYGNNIFLRGAPKICEAETKDKYKMVAAGIPYVFKEDSSIEIQGEVYKVTPEVLKYDLDRLEGHPWAYYREVIKVKGNDGNDYDAWIYFFPEKRMSWRGNNAKEVKSGSYHDHIQERRASWNG